MLDQNGQRVNYRTDVRETGPNQYVTQVGSADLGAPTRATYIESDEEYGRALDVLNPVCVDIIVMYGPDWVMLGKRRQEPQNDWWVFGGRMTGRESFEEAAARNMFRELRYRINPAQLSRIPIGAYRLCWDTRAQEPVQNGCQMISLPFVYRSQRPDEFDVTIHNEEYSAVSWFPVADVVSGQHTFHPALRDMVAAARRFPY